MTIRSMKKTLILLTALAFISTGVGFSTDAMAQDEPSSQPTSQPKKDETPEEPSSQPSSQPKKDETPDAPTSQPTSKP